MEGAEPDYFMQIVGKHFIEDAANEMTILDESTNKIKERHAEVCDFFGFARNDDLRKEPHEFFKMWKEFFVEVETAMGPKTGSFGGEKRVF